MRFYRTGIHTRNQVREWSQFRRGEVDKVSEVA
jgi:hypothetical protein